MLHELDLGANHAHSDALARFVLGDSRASRRADRNQDGARAVRQSQFMLHAWTILKNNCLNLLGPVAPCRSFSSGGGLTLWAVTEHGARLGGSGLVDVRRMRGQAPGAQAAALAAAALAAELRHDLSMPVLAFSCSPLST